MVPANWVMGGAVNEGAVYRGAGTGREMNGGRVPWYPRAPREVGMVTRSPHKVRVVCGEGAGRGTGLWLRDGASRMRPRPHMGWGHLGRHSASFSGCPSLSAAGRWRAREP